MTELDPALRRRAVDARVARLATVSPDGRPHVVPIKLALTGDTVVTAVDHKPKTTTSLQRFRNIEANPVASVLIDHYDEDWSQLWWVRGDGAARVVDEAGVREEALQRLADKYAPYQETTPLGPVIAITVERWASWAP